MKRQFVVLALVLFVVPASLFAQARTTGGVLGKVVDESGTPIADVTITVTAITIAVRRSTEVVPTVITMTLTMPTILIAVGGSRRRHRQRGRLNRDR